MFIKLSSFFFSVYCLLHGATSRRRSSSNNQRSILEQQIKQKRQQAPHIRASDLQIIRSDGNKEAIHAYNGNLFINFYA